MTIFRTMFKGKFEDKYLAVVDLNIYTIVAEARERVWAQLTSETISTDSGDLMFDAVHRLVCDSMHEQFPELDTDWDDDITDLSFEVATIVDMSGYGSVEAMLFHASVAKQLIEANVYGFNK